MIRLVEMMKKASFGMIVLFLFFSETVYADEYRWDLINALVRNDFETIENILKTNIAAMSVPDKRLVMNFALNYSSGENTLKACELLLKYNISPNAFDLYTAINRNRQNNTIQFLLKNGALPNGEILLLTMEKQRFDLARQFIEANVDVNYQYPLSKNYTDGMTPLLYASKWENLEIVKLLVEHGANINMQAVNGDTALSIARKNNNDTIYNYLTEHGAAELVNNNTSIQNSGISNMLDSNKLINFQRGKYRLFSGTMEINFLGNTNSGNINYIRNGRLNNGFYTIEGNNLTIIMENRTFVYKIDSDISFSGNGETWVRIGN
jgi:ankyrin repeat protein